MTRGFLGLVFFSLISSYNIAQTNSVRINEIMSLNQSSITDAEGNNSDWIELYNSSDESIILIGWFLSDEIANPQKWVFPSVVVQPNEYLIVLQRGTIPYIQAENCIPSLN